MMVTGRWLAGTGLVALVAAAVGVYGVASASESAPPAVGPLSMAAPFVAPKPTPTPSVEPVLSGTRRVTIVRVGAFESGLSLLDGGRLTEVDDDRGRQVFVPTPVGGQEFLIKSYHGGGTGQPLCWQTYNPGDSRPLVVRGATCRAGDPLQRFVITGAQGGGAREFVISNSWAYLRTTARNGLILEELGDASPFDSFRFNDTGPAPRHG
ncbi:hypothetical protein [Micromonospora sp. NPDC049900]|uniref:hypothetical protein n=1 Tax=unclassified Micromonospora TaxID=2617518 RepID=UPI00379B4417